MDRRLLLVYQCKACKRIVSDSSFLVYEYKDCLVLKDATTMFGPEKEIEASDKIYMKVHAVQCHCETEIGIYCTSAPADEQEFIQKYLLFPNKLLRHYVGRGCARDDDLKSLTDRLLDIEKTVNVTSKDIERIKVVLRRVAKNDPDVINMLKKDYNSTNVFSAIDSV